MKYIVGESLYYFRAWAGGKDTLDDLLAHNVVDKAEEYIDERTDYEVPVTRTEIKRHSMV